MTDQLQRDRVVLAQIDEASAALSALEKLTAPGEPNENEDLFDFVSNLSSLMSFAVSLVPNARVIRDEQRG